MENFRQAPKLVHIGKKTLGKNFYQLPQSLMDSILQQLDGKCGNQIKLMCVLLGTLGDGSFKVSEKWISQRTGMTQQAYNKTRQALIRRGWLSLKDGCLKVNINVINSYKAAGTISESDDIFDNVPLPQFDDVHNIEEINIKDKLIQKEMIADDAIASQQSAASGNWLDIDSWKLNYETVNSNYYYNYKNTKGDNDFYEDEFNYELETENYY